METINIKFEGIDNYNRPIFRDEKKNRYGSVDYLFDFEASEDEVLEKIKEEHLTFFGKKFGCEPMGTAAYNLEITPTRSVQNDKRRLNFKHVKSTKAQIKQRKRLWRKACERMA